MCEILSQRYQHPKPPQKGSVYIVAHVYNGSYIWKHHEEGGALVLHGLHSCNPDNEFYANRFRKVTPPQADEFDREVIELMTKKKVDTSA